VIFVFFLFCFSLPAHDDKEGDNLNNDNNRNNISTNDRSSKSSSSVDINNGHLNFFFLISFRQKGC